MSERKAGDSAAMGSPGRCGEPLAVGGTRSWLKHALGLSVLLLADAAFFWPLLTPDAAARLHIRAGDFSNQFYAFHSFAAQELAAGRLPLWNPHIFAGHPFLADIQTAFFYPVGLLVALLLGRDGLSFGELEYRVMAAYPMAGVFTYLLVYQLTRSPMGALLGAIAFSLGGFLTSYPMQQLPILETSIWLPLILLLLERSVVGQRALPALVLAGLALAVAALAGHPQTLLFIAYAASAYLVWRRWQVLPSGLPLPSKVSRWLYGLVWQLPVFWLLAFGIAAVQLVPSLELMQLTRRVTMPYEEAAVGYEPASLVATILPDWRGEHGPYVGLMPLVLALVALQTGQRPYPWFWLGMGLAGAAISLGGNGPLYPLLHAVAPGFALFRHQERGIILYALALAVLAGCGLGGGALGRPSAPSAGRSRWVVSVLVAVLAVAAVAVRSLMGIEAMVGQALYASLLLGAAILWVRGRQAPARASLSWPLLAVALTVLDLFVVNFGVNFASAEPRLSSEAMLVAQMVREDAAERAAGEPFRVRVQTDDHDAFPANYGHLAGLQQIGGDTPMVQRRLADLAEANNEWRLWELLNVRHTISRRPLDGALDYLGQLGQLRIYRNQWPVPRVWAVRDIRLAGSPEEALRLALSPDVRPGFAAVLEEDPYLRYPSLARPEQRFRFLAYEPTNLRFAITLSADALVVASEAYYPGWRAFVDGQEVPIYRASYYLRAVPVRAGTHVVEMRFEPVSLRIGAWISLLALAVCLAVAALGRLVPARPQAATP